MILLWPHLPYPHLHIHPLLLPNAQPHLHLYLIFYHLIPIVDLAIPTPSLPIAVLVKIPSSNPSHHMTTRSQTDSFKPKTFPDYKLFTSTKHPFYLFHTILHETEPNCYSKAGFDARWRDAMKSEFDALISNGT